MMRHLLILLILSVPLTAVETVNAAGSGTQLEVAMLDAAAFREWVPLEGERAVHAVGNGGAPTDVIFTTSTRPSMFGMNYGVGASLGPRRLRIGFTVEVPVGTILARGDRVDVLRPDAKYPGDLADDAQWRPAQRMQVGALSTAGPDHNDYVLWVLPPGTKTRALRFTHAPLAGDADPSGHLAGAVVYPERFADLRLLAGVSSRRRTDLAPLLIDGRDNGWQFWESTFGPVPGPSKMTPTDPEVLTVWFPSAQPLSAIALLNAGFSACEVQVYTGPQGLHPNEAGKAHWRTVVAATTDHMYPWQLPINRISLPHPETTRAVRLRLTQPAAESHNHLSGSTKDGTRAWLSELIPLRDLGAAPLIAPTVEKDHPPIPITFRLDKPGWVTLVIEDGSGKRVRNLISETQFPAGDNTAWWDGMDDIDRDALAAETGTYRVPGKVVAPATYQVRGLVRGNVDLRWQQAFYRTLSLADHTPPKGACFVPGDQLPDGKPSMLLGAYVAEAGVGLGWFDLDGVMHHSLRWLGGVWTGAPYLACDLGAARVPAFHAYAVAALDSELRVGAVRADYGSEDLVKQPIDKGATVDGLAVHDGLLAISLRSANQLMFIDVAKRAVLGRVPLADPRGLAFVDARTLLAVSGTSLLRLTLPAERLGAASYATELPAKVVVSGLDDPQQVTRDVGGAIYVSVRGASHQVKVFNPDGSPLRTIGVGGAPKSGPYDAKHMNNPAAIAVDDTGRLWVTEEDQWPKRVSIWNRDGTLSKAMYGQAGYGGGGALDRDDRKVLYYQGKQFALDRTAGTDRLVAVLARGGEATLALPGLAGDMPEDPLQVNGRLYLHNSFSGAPTNGTDGANLWTVKDGVAKPVASIGMLGGWPTLIMLMKGDAAWRARWPAGCDPVTDGGADVLYAWSDANDDGKLQPAEVTCLRTRVGLVVIQPDLSVVTTMTLRFEPTGFSPGGAPLYDLNKATTLVPGARMPNSSGGGQVLQGEGGWVLLTTPPEPFPAYLSLAGARDGVPMWTYPNLWPGLHPSHSAPPPQFSGEIIGPTKLLGPLIKPNAEIGQVFALNGNHGQIFLMTMDGLFLASLFQDKAFGKSRANVQRGMLLNDTTLNEENFFPSIVQYTDNGEIVLIDGFETSLVTVEGLATAKRIPAKPRVITPAELTAAQDWQLAQEAKRKAEQGQDKLIARLRATAPTVDGDLAEWDPASFVTVEGRMVRAGEFFHSLKAAVAVADGKLFAAFRTETPNIAVNGCPPGNWQTQFKNGGGLDLMIGSDLSANPYRSEPVAGDLRLLVALVEGKVQAVLYRPVAPGAPAEERATFTSPVWSFAMDSVTDVSAQVVLKGAAGANGDFELSVPLAVLGLKPVAGQMIRGDIGWLRGDGTRTQQRVYWSNKGTGIVSDVPSEARLSPLLWGFWLFLPDGEEGGDKDLPAAKTERRAASPVKRP